MRIESAFIADHVEVDPTTGMLDVQSGFQNCAKVPNLPFRHVMGLAIVVQVAFDEYDHPFRLTIDVERVDGLPVMHHEDFTFEIPHGIGAMDGISHHFPFAFSLPVEFYEVGVHRIIVGDDDSDSAVIPFVVEMVTLEHDRVRSSGCATFAQPMSPPGDQRIRNRRSSGPYAQGDARLAQHSANPCLVRGSETWLQAANPQLIEPTGQFCSGSLVQSTTGAVKLMGVLTIASGRSDMTEILGRETIDRGRSFLVLAP